MIVLPVPLEHVAQAWLLAAPMIEKARERLPDREEAMDIFSHIVTGHYQLWVAIEVDVLVAACVSKIQEHPRARSIHIPYLGGDEHRIGEWGPVAWDAFEDFARKNHCSHISIEGRPGWKTFLAPRGFKVLSHTFERKL